MQKIGSVLAGIAPDRQRSLSSISKPQQTHSRSRCATCGGIGFFSYDVAPTDARFGKAVPCNCQNENRRIGKIEKLNEISDQVDPSATFDAFNCNRADISDSQRIELEEAYRWAIEIAKWPETTAPTLKHMPWLTLAGNYGTGKSHLGKAIWNYRQTPSNGADGAVMVLVPDMLDYIKQAFNGKSDDTADERFESIRQVDTVLILDDLGTESSSEWVEAKMFQLFNWRYDHQLPTVILTNVSFRDLEPRIADRLRDGICCSLTAPTFRGKKQGPRYQSENH